MPAVQLSLRVGFGYDEDSGAFEQALPPSRLSLFLFGIALTRGDEKSYEP